jgi:hypothetical protein
MGRDYYYGAIGDLEEQQAAAISGLNEWPEAQRGPWLVQLRRRLAQQSFWLAHKAFIAGDRRGMDRCLEFSSHNDPHITTSRQWLRFRVKRRLGRSVWRALEPLARGLRRQAPPPPVRDSEHFKVGKLTGWGPAAESCWSA